MNQEQFPVNTKMKEKVVETSRCTVLLPLKLLISAMIPVIFFFKIIRRMFCSIKFENLLEMYEISPYATFSVSGGRTCSTQVKTPTRGVNNSTLDYTVQFKTFGHPEGDNLNATAYPMLPSSGFGHVKGKSSWHKQRFIGTDGNYKNSR